jgi:hypothetical protein
MRMRLDEFLEMNGRVGAVVATTLAQDQLEIVTLQQVPQFARPSRDRRAQTPERFGQEKDYPGHDPGRPLGGWLVADGHRAPLLQIDQTAAREFLEGGSQGRATDNELSAEFVLARQLVGPARLAQAALEQVERLADERGALGMMGEVMPGTGRAPGISPSMYYGRSPARPDERKLTSRIPKRRRPPGTSLNRNARPSAEISRVEKRRERGVEERTGSWQTDGPDSVQNDPRIPLVSRVP